MPLPLITLISGLSGVFIVMTLLMIMVRLSSKLAIALEKKQEKQESQGESAKDNLIKKEYLSNGAFSKYVGNHGI